MNVTTATSRVASLVNDLRSTDWERRLGTWGLTFLAVSAALLLVNRLQNTVTAVNGERPIPGLPDGPIDLLFILPLDVFPKAFGAAILYILALGVWRVVDHWRPINTLRARFIAIFAAGFVPAALFGLAVATWAGYGMATGQLTEAAAMAEFATFTDTLWVREAAVWAAASAALAGVASWRRSEFELTARRQQILTVAAVVIVVAPAILGAVGLGAAGQPSPPPAGDFDAADLDDGYGGPSHAEAMNHTNLSVGAYQPATAVLSCGAVNDSQYALPEWMAPGPTAATEINISSPDDADRVYLEVAPYRNDSGVVHGRYAARLVPVQEGNWTLLDYDIYNDQVARISASSSFVTGDVALDSDTGQLVMENVEAMTLELELVNPDGEIVRVRYRLCRPGATE